MLRMTMAAAVAASLAHAPAALADTAPYTPQTTRPSAPVTYTPKLERPSAPQTYRPATVQPTPPATYQPSTRRPQDNPPSPPVYRPSGPTYTR